MMSRKHLLVLLIVALVCSTAYGVAQQLTGHSAEAFEFMKWALGGITTAGLICLIFGLVSDR